MGSKPPVASIAFLRTSMQQPDITGTPRTGVSLAGIDDVAQIVAVEASREESAHEAGRVATQQEIEHGGIALAQEIVGAVRARHGRRRRDHVRIRVEPAYRVDERVGRELDVGIQHQLIVAAGAVQHQVVRDAVPDVRMAVQEVELHPGIREVLPAQPDPDFRALRILAVVDQGQRRTRDDALLARDADRPRQMGEAALEQCGIGPIRDDADGQRRGEHGGAGFETALAAAGCDPGASFAT